MKRVILLICCRFDAQRTLVTGIGGRWRRSLSSGWGGGTERDSTEDAAATETTQVMMILCGASAS